jgi:lipid II:glycine glycyltransferase (peptidoglycan interpeptide bridge formation enzyme)
VDGWNDLVSQFPQAHVLQTWEWGQIKARFGWEPVPKIWRSPGDEVQAAALALVRHVPIRGFAPRLGMVYVPKGPLLKDWGDRALRRQVYEDLRLLAIQQGAIFVKIDPDVCLGEGFTGEVGATEDPLGQVILGELSTLGWRFSGEQVQFRNTVLIDLSRTEEELLSRMKPKMRYNLRLAERKGVTVRTGGYADLDLLYQMYAGTAARDGFIIREQAYYHALWREFIRAGLAEPLIAEVGGESIAAVIIFRFAGKAWYLYGMSRSVHREKMPNHLLQWEAMRRAKASGCLIYDLWGAPDELSEKDPLWGVYRFKVGLGGRLVRTLGAWDLPVRPGAYRLFTQVIPYLLDLMRRRSRARARLAI